MVKTLAPPPSDGVIHTEFGITHANWDAPTHLGYSQTHSNAFMPTVSIERGDNTVDLPYANTMLDIDNMSFDDLLTGTNISGNQFLNRRLFNDALLVWHRGQVLHESYRNGMTEHDRHINHSTTKSFVAMLIGIAIDEGLMVASELFDQYFPELKEIPTWSTVTLQQVLDMSAGLKYDEHYEDPNSMFWSYAKAAGYCPAEVEEAVGCKDWFLANMTETECEPGHRFNYTSPYTNALVEALQNVYKKPFVNLLEEKIYRNIGAEADAWFNLDPKGFPMADGQLNTTLRDFTRGAYLMLNQGRSLTGAQVISDRFIKDVWQPQAQLKDVFARGDYGEVFPDAHYRNQFWVLEPEKERFAMLGIHGQFAWFDLMEDLLIVGFGSHPEQASGNAISALQQLWGTTAQAVEKLK